MKTLYLTTFTCLFSLVVIGQDCPTEDVTLLSQAQVDSFAVKYPNCTEVDVKITVGPSYDLLNLQGLSNIQKTTESLVIFSNDNLEKLDGLSNLREVKTLDVSSNSKLKDLQGLESLQTVSHFLFIVNNGRLRSIEEVTDIDSISGLFIYDNPALQSIAGFNELRRLSVLDIHNCDSVQIVKGFNGLLKLGGNFKLPSMNKLSEIDAFHNLKVLAGMISIGTDSLIRFDAFDKLEEASSIRISGTSKLRYIPPFDNLSKCASVRINSNNSLLEVRGFNQLASGPVDLNIVSNPSLEKIDGFRNLDSIFSLDLSFQRKLVRVTGFDKLVSIKRSVQCDVMGVKDLLFFSQLQSTCIVDDVANFQCTFSIDYLPNLKSLDGLENYTYVGYRLTVGGHDSLANISGLRNIDPTTVQDFLLTANPMLSDCANDFTCEYVKQNPEARIFNNAPGCNSVEEVLEACLLLSVIEDENREEAIVYPNPTEDAISIAIGSELLDNELITIISMDGKVQVCKLLGAKSLDVRKLSTGVYTALVKTAKGQQGVRIFKL